LSGNSKIEALLSLLEDENRGVASRAMAELLRDQNGLAPCLKIMQESDNPVLRKRAHQIQSIIRIRQRRTSIARALACKDTPLIEGLAELHLQWYDYDPEDDIMSRWEELLAEAVKFHPRSLERLSYFMHKRGFSTPPDNELDADCYCLGVVLEERVGADVILCALGRELARSAGLELKIHQLMDRFVLAGPGGFLLSPADGWRIFPPTEAVPSLDWDSNMTLRMTASVMFICAVCSDSFRYVNTIGSCLAKVSGKDSLSFLPYPYDSAGC
jgi:hypothetical protein